MWFKKFVIYQYTMYATALYAMAVRLSIRYQESETNLNAHSKKNCRKSFAQASTRRKA